MASSQTRPPSVLRRHQDLDEPGIRDAAPPALAEDEQRAAGRQRERRNTVRVIAAAAGDEEILREFHAFSRRPERVNA